MNTLIYIIGTFYLKICSSPKEVAVTDIIMYDVKCLDISVNEI